MKKIYRLLILLVGIIALSSCSSSKSEELTDLIQMPKQESPSITGNMEGKGGKEQEEFI